MKALGIGPDGRLQAVTCERDVEAMGGDESGNRPLKRPVTETRDAFEMSSREEHGAGIVVPRERDLPGHDVEEHLFVLSAPVIGDAIGDLLEELRQRA